MADPYPVGIDLGTTRLAAAGVDPLGRSTMLRSGDGELFLPSAVLFDDDETIVGREAKRALESDLDRVADCPLRDLGQERYWRLVRGRAPPPEVVLAALLGRIAHNLPSAGGASPEVVLAIPAMFDSARGELRSTPPRWPDGPHSR